MHARLTFDYREVRAIMAYYKIKPADLAIAAKVSKTHLIKILNGFPPGERAVHRIRKGLAVLGFGNIAISIQNTQGKENAASTL